MEQNEKDKWQHSADIASRLMKKAVSMAKPDASLLEIAEHIESEAEKLNVKWAFPINLSINEIAAHYSPFYDDQTKAQGLLKIDLGINVDGYISDIAKSVDLTPDNKFKDLIKASENALAAAIKTAKKDIELREIGKAINNELTKMKFTPIRNLSGHEMQKYELHAGLAIPNYDNKDEEKLPEGVFAVEPFATTGQGLVVDGKPSGIYILKNSINVRDTKTREILEFIQKEYKTLPFSGRWIIKKFGLRARLSLRMLEQQNILHQFAQLVEVSKSPVSQAEKTILIEKDKMTVLTID